ALALEDRGDLPGVADRPGLGRRACGRLGRLDRQTDAERKDRHRQEPCARTSEHLVSLREGRDNDVAPRYKPRAGAVPAPRAYRAARKAPASVLLGLRLPPPSVLPRCPRARAGRPLGVTRA